ncbi:hypothetical protein QJS10_CPB17g01989 [Acorus calamus]|uniref:Glycosyltransferase 61 catalytic domain-containing protein n=1 Tax=Acorus calamus TaxID=4465 RepID=A0AAV9CWK4_ACOCL|nr:hypothetical protein QJS10_CPB17g01989 [Acorus calamus]
MGAKFKNPYPKKFLSLLCLSTLALLIFYHSFVPNKATLQNKPLFYVPSSRPTNAAAATDGILVCNRTGYRSDICHMRGVVRARPPNSVTVHSTERRHETVRPYTRKWETSIMSKITQLNLASGPDVDPRPCDVHHHVPALFFSAGGYTGNTFHEFNDGIVPLYISARAFNRRVVLVVLNYSAWWESKYRDVLARLTDHRIVDFERDARAHCFPEAFVGLHIHGDLTIDPSKARETNASIADFRALLDEAYKPTIHSAPPRAPRPKLVIFSREGSRAITNEEALVRLSESIGFDVERLAPKPTTTLKSIYKVLSACDAAVGVHGAAMTHFFFMRPGAVFVQIVPVGILGPARACFAGATEAAGLKYVEYVVEVEESSLYAEYGRDAEVVREPGKVNARGWEETKRVYLDGQNVTLDLARFRGTLEAAFENSERRRREESIAS